MDVGVDVRLKEPGDSERRVEEPLLCAKLGAGCAKFGVEVIAGGCCRLLYVAMMELEVA